METIIENAKAIINGKKEKTLQDKYNDLMVTFGSEQGLRSEMSIWFTSFIAESDIFNGGDREGEERKNAINRADFVFRFTEMLEFFTGNATEEN